MMKLKVLNLYACLWGNRYLWDNCEVTAVELDPELARMYQERFPNDIVIIADAHQYLLDHYREFDFIWTSPPCPTHSRVRFSQKNKDYYKAQYPSMVLYEEIIFLKHHFEWKYVVENVIPYYKPLIQWQTRWRHIYWCNFELPTILSERKQPKISNNKDEVSILVKFHNIDLSWYKWWQRKDKISRNLVDYEAWKTIYDTMRWIKNSNIVQNTLF